MPLNLELSLAQKRFRQISFLLIFYTVLVILWGAWVRISHSGDGCGDTWPLCHGQLVPEAARGKTWVEYAHRSMSGLFGIFIILLYWRARKLFPKTSLTRKAALWSLIFMITEALLGAKLVLFKLVGTNDSPFRAVAMGLHLVNSLLLAGALTFTWDFSKNLNWKRRSENPFETQVLKTNKLVWACIFGFILIGVTGALAALSSTLFPATSLAEGLRADWDPSSHYLVRLRGLHPLMGLMVGGGLALSAWMSMNLLKPEMKEARTRALRLTLILLVGILFGISTLVSLAPVGMKLGHLTLAYTIWIFLLLWLRSLVFEGE
jgi:cytochrome c oxidase assembly protein subunit 15